MNQLCQRCGKYTVYIGTPGTGEMCNCGNNDDTTMVLKKMLKLWEKMYALSERIDKLEEKSK